MYSPFQESSSKIYSLAKNPQLEDVLNSLKEPNLKNQDVLKLEDIPTLPNLKMYFPKKPYLKMYSSCQKPYLKMYLPYQKNQTLMLYLLCQKRHACSCTHLAKRHTCSCTHLAKRAILVGCQEVLCGLKAVSTLYKHIKIQSNKQSTVQTHQNTVKQTEDCINTSKLVKQTEDCINTTKYSQTVSK